MLERGGGGHGEDGRARRHDFADQLVTEFDGGAHQFAIALFEDSLFLTGFKQGFDVDGGLFFRAGRLLSKGGDGEEEADEDADGRDHPEEHPNGPDEAHGPQATRAVEQERGKNWLQKITMRMTARTACAIRRRWAARDAERD